MVELKQVILVRSDLKLTRGKMSAQAAHASVDAVLRSKKTTIDAWRDLGMKKTVLAVADETELRSLIATAQREGLVVSVISDAGHTHLTPGTTTCGAIGPAPDVAIDTITGHLKLIN